MLWQFPSILTRKDREKRMGNCLFQEFDNIWGKIPHLSLVSPGRAAHCCSLDHTPPEQSWQELGVHPKFSVCFLVHIREQFFLPEPSPLLARGSDFTRSGMNSAFKLLLTTPETLMGVKYPCSTKSNRYWGSTLASTQKFFMDLRW